MHRYTNSTVNICTICFNNSWYSVGYEWTLVLPDPFPLRLQLVPGVRYILTYETSRAEHTPVCAIHLADDPTVPHHTMFHTIHMAYSDSHSDMNVAQLQWWASCAYVCVHNMGGYQDLESGNYGVKHCGKWKLG